MSTQVPVAAQTPNNVKPVKVLLTPASISGNSAVPATPAPAAAQAAPTQTTAAQVTTPQAAPAPARTIVRDLRIARFYKGSKSVFYITASRQSAPDETEVSYWQHKFGSTDWTQATKAYSDNYEWKVIEIPADVVIGQLPPCPGLNAPVQTARGNRKVNVIPANKNSPKCVKCGGKNKKIALLVSETYYCPTCEA